MLGKFYEMFKHDMHNLYSNLMHLKGTILQPERMI